MVAVVVVHSSSVCYKVGLLDETASRWKPAILGGLASTVAAPILR